MQKPVARIGFVSFLRRSVGLTLALFIATGPDAQTETQSFAERLMAKAAALEILKELDPRDLNRDQLQKIAEALLLGVEYGSQARLDEESGYKLAHQKAAYDWGYKVGDPKTVKMVRLYWEGVQLGIFAFGDLQEQTGGKSERWATIESMVGGNGQEYDINESYIEDIFYDVQIAVDGATRAERGEESDFETFAALKNLN